MTGTAAAMIATAGATCGAPKRGWNGWSRPFRRRERRANAAMPRKRAKSGAEEAAPWGCSEQSRPKSAKRRSRKACSAALRRSGSVSRASSMSSTCSGRQLATAAISRCWRWTPAAPAVGAMATPRSGCPWKGHRPALPRSRSQRHLQAGSLPPAAFPGMLRKGTVASRCPSVAKPDHSRPSACPSYGPRSGLAS